MTVKHETLKVLEQNIGSTLEDKGVGRGIQNRIILPAKHLINEAS